MSRGWSGGNEDKQAGCFGVLIFLFVGIGFASVVLTNIVA